MELPNNGYPRFDPDRFTFKDHRMSTTQGSYSIYMDGHKVITYGDDIYLKDGKFQGASHEEKLLAAKMLYERGHAIEGIAPLSGRSSYITADSPDVIALETIDGTPFFCQIDHRGDVNFFIMDEAALNDSSRGDGVFLKQVLGGQITLPAVWDSNWQTTLLNEEGRKLVCAAPEFQAIHTFMRLRVRERKVSTNARLSGVIPDDTVAKDREQLHRFEAELASLKDYIALRGKEVRISAVTAYDPDSSESYDIDLRGQGVIGKVSKNIMVGDLSSRWDQDGDGMVLDPIWPVEVDAGVLALNGKTLQNPILMPFSYRPGKPRESGDIELINEDAERPVRSASLSM